MTNTTVWLSQLQFFSSLGFMALFFAIELGLAWVLLFFRLGLHFGQPQPWREAYRLWVRVFALASILALAASLPVFIQLGSVWPLLAEIIGDVSGPLVAASLLTAFIFKAGFSGAMLFGERRLQPWTHTLTVFMVAMGSTGAAFWIVTLQAWMQMPSGVQWLDGRYEVSHWAHIIFNPLVPWLAGGLLAVAILSTAFLLMGVSVRQSFRHPPDPAENLAFNTGLILAMAASVLVVVLSAGFLHAAAPEQAGRAAATAAYWQSGKPPELLIFAWPDIAGLQNRLSLAWPADWARYWLARDSYGIHIGLDRLAGMHPPVALTFWLYRAVVYLGVFLAFISWLTFFRLRLRKYGSRSLPRVWRRFLAGLSYSGWLCVLGLLAFVWLGNAPYVVGNTVTLSQLVGNSSPGSFIVGIAATWLVGLVLVLGFVRLVHYFALFGVVPVVRHRGKA